MSLVLANSTTATYMGPKVPLPFFPKSKSDHATTTKQVESCIHLERAIDM